MKVLVAIDTSIYAQQVVEAVGKRSWPADSEFMLVTAVDRCRDEKDEQAFVHEAQMLLDERAKYLRYALKTRNISDRIDVGNALDVIVAAAKFWHADVIVIGSNGDGGIKRTHLGQVASHIVNASPCSIDIVKVEHHPVAAVDWGHDRAVEG
jgi:nucleotide-binding universal stress UspA family protein